MSLISIVPNIFSVLRIFVAILFPLILSKGYAIYAFLILITGSISDFLDGYLARKLNVESEFGALLDPIADKVFANSILWSLYIFQSPKDIKFSVFLVAILLSIRDIAMLFCSSIILLKQIKMNLAPLFLSKICTTTVFILCILLLLFPSNFKLLYYTSNSCLFLILLTSIMYLLRYLKTIYY